MSQRFVVVTGALILELFAAVLAVTAAARRTSFLRCELLTQLLTFSDIRSFFFLHLCIGDLQWLDTRLRNFLQNIAFILISAKHDALYINAGIQLTQYLVMLNVPMTVQTVFSWVSLGTGRTSKNVRPLFFST